MSYDPASDPYAAGDVGGRRNRSDPSTRVAAPTKSDTVDEATYFKALMVDTAGVLKYLPARNADNAPITQNVVAGQVISCRVRRVWNTTTTAVVFGLFD